MIVDPHEIQRLRFIPRQDLLSRDFRGQAGFDEQLRWWHNRAMHGAFGVRDGLQVTAVTAVAEFTVEIEKGLAYDAFGRELILPAARRLRVPAGPGEEEPRLLVIRYREDGDAPHPADLAGVCLGQPAPQGADLVWLPERRLRPADGVPLARVLYDDGQPVLPVPDAKFHPPAARPLARPRLGHGSTISGATPWEVWVSQQQEQRIHLGLQLSIDTRAAGFTELPCYFAWVQGGIPTDFDDGLKRRFFLPLFPHLAEETPNGFRFRLLTFGPASGETPVHGGSLISMARRHLSLCWLGIQMPYHEGLFPEVVDEHP